MANDDMMNSEKMLSDLQEAVKNSEQLNSNISNTTDIASGMFKNAQNDLKKLTKSIEKFQSGKMPKDITDALKDIKKLQETKLDKNNIIKAITDADMLKKDAEAWKEMTKEINQVAPSLKDLASSVEYLPTSFKDSTMEMMKFDDELHKTNEEAIAATGASKSFFKALTGGNPIISAITGVVGGLISQLYDLVKRAFTETYDYINKYLLPTYSELNKEFGNTKNLDNLKRQAIQVGNEFRSLGLSFEQGTTAVKELTSEMNNPELTTKSLKSLIKISEYSGLGAKKTGEFANVFQALGGSISDVDKAFASAKNLTGIPNKLRRELGENIDLVIRFGVKNVESAKKSINSMMNLRLNVKEVTKAFRDQLDTFEATSEASAKLNTVFGTNINSYKLLLETDPSKRLAMVRDELEKQGKSFDKLNVFQQNVIASTLHLSKEEAAKAFASKKVRDQLEAQAAAQAKAAKTSDEWEKGILNLKKTLIDVSYETQQFFMSVGNLVSRLLGFDSGVQATTKGVDIFKTLIRDATHAVDDIAKSIDPKKNNMIDFKTIFEKIQKVLSNAPELFDEIAGTVQSTSKSIRDLADTIQDLAQPWDSFFARKRVNDFENLQTKSIDEIREFQRNLQDTDEDTRNIFLRKVGGETAFNKKIAELMNQATKGGNVESVPMPGMTMFKQKQEVPPKNDTFISKDGKVIPISDQDNVMAKKGSMSSPQIIVKIEPANIILDGKKIAEVQFRNSVL